MRREGESAWHALTVAGASGSYSAVLDDSLYPKGSYEVRARVFDHAENEKTIATYPGGNPIANVSVDVLERIDAPARPWQAVGTARTNANGSFTFRVPKGASRTIRFSYGGSPTSQPSARDVEIRVKAAATIRPDRRKLTNGDEVTLKGRVTSGPIPETGKLVTLQALTRRGWTTFGNARARAKDGRYSYRYRFTGTTVRSRYTFRVLVPAESGYAYVQGASKTTRVLVDP